MSPVQTLYPGVYVVEDPSSVHTIVGVPTSVVGFVGAAPRGPVNTPVHVTNWSDYERTFGSLDAGAPLSYAVFLYFVNGGSLAEVVRADGTVERNANGTIKTDNRAQPATLQVKQDGIEFTLEASSPGAWANGMTATIDHTNAAAPVFNLTLKDLSGRQEQYRRVSVEPMENATALKTALSTSSLVRLAEPSGGDAKAGDDKGGDAKAADAGPPSLGGGADFKGTTIDVAIGWQALASVDIFTVLCLPTDPTATYSAEILSTAAAFCQKHRAVLVVDPPGDWPAASGAVAGFDDVTTKPSVTGDALSYAAIYYPNLTLTDRATGTTLTVGPSGAVAGVWARTDAQRGVWKTPAGTGAAVTGVGDVQVRLTDDQNGTLNPLAVNCLKVIPFSGPVVWGGRTAEGADTSTPWKYLAVRRTALFIEESLRRGTQWAVFEPNDEPLWASIRLNVGAFMNTLFRPGAFQGSTARRRISSSATRENNPQNDIDRGIVNIIVGFAPLKPAEFVIIHIEQMAGQLQV